MASFEYVMSGCGYTKLTTSRCHNNSIRKPIIELLSKLNKDGHQFSLLYNAYTETKFGKIFRENYDGMFHKIHADSGGLQMITRGEKLDFDAKKVIYNNQSKWSDIAMSFDEIPVVTTTKKAVRGVTDFRRFDVANLEMYARNSGKNLLEQIDVFLENKSTSKPIAIIQGNCIESFKDWFNYLLDEIPDDKKKYIGGLSISAAAHGTGILEAVERAALMREITLDNKCYHLLGIGSLRNIIPYVAFLKSGFLDYDSHFSYDSTTHTSALSRRESIDMRGVIRYGTVINEKYEDLYQKLSESYPELNRYVNDPKELCDVMNYVPSKVDKNTLQYMMAAMIFLSSNVSFLKDSIDNMMRSDKFFEKVARRTKTDILVKNLQSLRDIEDFNDWKQQYSKFYRTDKVKRLDNSNTLEDLLF